MCVDCSGRVGINFETFIQGRRTGRDISLWCRFSCVCFPLLRDVTVTLPNQEAVIVYFLKIGFSMKHSLIPEFLCLLLSSLKFCIYHCIKDFVKTKDLLLIVNSYRI